MQINKKMTMLFLFMVTFLLGIDYVNAITCTYGEGTSDNFKTYFQIKITGYNEYTIAYNESDRIIPIVGGDDYLKPANDEHFDFYIDSFDQAICEAYLGSWKVNLFGWEPSWDCSYRTKYTYTGKLYANREAYEISKDYCPERITLCSQTSNDSLLKGFVDSFFGDDDNEVLSYFFYKDGLTEIEGEDSSWFYSIVSDATCVDLKEQSLADIEFDEPISTSDCATYDEYMKVLQIEASTGGCSSEKFTEHYRDLLALCDNYSSSTMYTDDDNTAKACMSSCSNIRDDVSKICGYDVSGSQTEVCNTFGERTLAWIFKIINMIRYIVPVLLIVLGILDFIKTIASDDEGEIKKAGARFVKRLIAAALVFIVPLILQFILNIFNLPGLDPNNPFCVL